MRTDVVVGKSFRIGALLLPIAGSNNLPGLSPGPLWVRRVCLIQLLQQFPYATLCAKPNAANLALRVGVASLLWLAGTGANLAFVSG